ncbi:MAG TPA: energy-coupling factor transporter ATPase [Candidatus Deferrimicrobium sp.]|nr:energy-coupling factor transporter ATPase [Candidatus Deferrimicrobium sp.]
MIAVNDVCFQYNSSEEPVLEHLNLQVRSGEMLTIMGANGSGKSTLARLFNALLIPQSGSVLVDGLDTAKELEQAGIRTKVGMVFQNPDNQIVAPTVEDDVAFGLENLGVEHKEMRERVQLALARMGLAGYAEASPSKLSGGQKQRVAIAGILAMNPKYLVLDEAGSMLDPKSRKELLNIVVELKHQGMGIVMITQHPEEALMGDTLVILNRGKIVHQGTPREVLGLEAALLNQYGLDTTTMSRLANSLRKRGVELPKGILTVEEMVNALC